MLSRFILVLSLCLGISRVVNAQDAAQPEVTEPVSASADHVVAEEESAPRSDVSEPPATPLADLRRDLQRLGAQHGDLVRGVVEHGLRALERAESREAAGDLVGKERALAIAQVAQRVAEKRVRVRAAQGRLRLLRSRIAALRARAES